MAPEWVSAISNVLTAVAAMLTVFFAFRGITAWRDEMVGRRKNESAFRIYSGFLRYKRLIEHVRSPLATSYEIGEVEKLIQDEDKKSQSSFLVAYWRLSEQSAEISKFFDLEIESVALFDKKFEVYFRECNRILISIRSASNALYRHGDNLSDKNSEKFEGRIWGFDDPNGEGEDDIFRKISEIIENVRNDLSQHLH